MVSVKSVMHIVLAVTALGATVALNRGAFAQEPAPTETVEQNPREQQLREQLKGILQELEDLQRSRESTLPPTERPKVVTEKIEPEEMKSPGSIPEYELADMSIISRRFVKRPEGISFSTTPRSETESQPTRNFRESLESIPGVIMRQRNGPRDFQVSIRGSGTKNGFGVRDVKFYEDGIGQTQSDGLSRLDSHDPWFMESVEVVRGASSSLYGNYALGGAVHFRTRRGRDINGVETFVTGGSWGYQKYAIAVGKEYANLDASLFASYAREDGYLPHSEYDTATVNLNLRFRIDDKQNFYFKAINNDLDARSPGRLTQSQFDQNARQLGGITNATTNPITLHSKRRDRRTTIGGLYERQIDANTILQIEGDYDVKDINQPTSVNINPNFKHYSNLIHAGSLFNMPLKSTVGFFFDYMEQEGASYRNLNDGTATFGPLQQQNRLTTKNIGARFREELQFIPNWTAILGFNYENSRISGVVTNYTATATTSTLASRVNVDRTFDNFAPEVALSFRPNVDTRIWTRASTGYAIPGLGQLTTGLDGAPGLNTGLKPQKNLNVELGTNSWLTKQFNLELVGFWIFFRNEIITQNVPIGPGVSGTFATNAEESQYRGVELAWKYLPDQVPGLSWTGAFTHMESKYVKFTDQFSSGGGPITQVNQSGHDVPAVEKNVLNSKVRYVDAQSGLGAWVEGSWIDSFWVNNNNTLGAPAYLLFNANLNYNYVPDNNRFIRFAKFYVEMDNIFNKKYVGNAVVAADSILDANKQAFLPGVGRGYYAGVTLGLW
ncbi:MAG: TonB-dependent receptor [Nitrospira sp. CG24C]|jgi:iron complex outermembrane receptor protein|nr:TonB-dependent receptor [Nitrospira sp.]THJ12427.1 MAG: TonB-dependent receptor [Nitrospira sp. CG24C]TKB52567.1 MAG: TonB-dependent receptor [Nitrospira sp.]